MSRYNFGSMGQAMDAAGGGYRSGSPQGYAPGAPMMNPVYAASMGAYGPMDWGGAANFAQMGNYSRMDPSTASFLSGQQNFGPQMGGALGQIGAGLGANAAAIGNQRMMDMQTQLMREGRHDSNEKFTMLFDALLKPQGDPEMFRDVDGNMRTRGPQSPLLKLLAQSMQPQGFGAFSAGSVAPYGGPMPGAGQIPTMYG